MKRVFQLLLFLAPLAVFGQSTLSALEKNFNTPPDSARPWVYWYFMDGNISREGLHADLEAMKAAGIGGGIWLEVNIGIPRGNIDFMSPEWQKLFTYGIKEADRLGLEIALGSGPGWCGTGGPWIKPEQSMQHLVSSETNVTGPIQIDSPLPRPQPRIPFFGMGSLTPEVEKQWREFYEDIAVLAFPTSTGTNRISDVDEKALYFRAPYSSQPGVKPFLPALATYPDSKNASVISHATITNLTAKLSKDGRLSWDVPPGKWTIMRFGRTITGQTTRPAPKPGLGLECDKFDRAATQFHFDYYVQTLINQVSPLHKGRGLTTLHFDSWEMSSQNWSTDFRNQFKKRRGYDPLNYFPVVAGYSFDNTEISERFLWDLRQTAQELVIENHVGYLKTLGARHGLKFSLEPYDLNPCSDLELGTVADIPQCEFWSKGYGFSTEYSCFEATSIAHTGGHSIVAAEAFTANPGEDWRLYPGNMKDQADWALCCGINRIIFHRYQHQPWLDRFPGMTMGDYGVHWDRTQTWWNMAEGFHTYLARCQQMLRQGHQVADILYLVPEGAPMVFRPPESATQSGLPDRKGYNFDGCAPSTLIKSATVKNGRITLPDGMNYSILVLPRFETMTPKLLQKIVQLTKAGATVIGNPPKKSPSLVDYPTCDQKIAHLANTLWPPNSSASENSVGKGRIIPDTDKTPGLYPCYEFTEQILKKMDISPDFQSTGNLRYIHRKTDDADIYFIANRETHPQTIQCQFHVTGSHPELWNPVTGQRRILPQFSHNGKMTQIPIKLDSTESMFIVFRPGFTIETSETQNFATPTEFLTITNTWTVSFDSKWGGPKQIQFSTLSDWSTNSNIGIKNYSGIAIYKTTFDIPSTTPTQQLRLSLGTVHNMASVKLNGKNLGIVWCDPWTIDIPAGLLTEKGNQIEITVANLWVNRLIADQALPPEKRLTWTTRNPFKPNTPLVSSGLIGPVKLQSIPFTQQFK